MLEAYPNDPELGCPLDGKVKEYGAGAQYKRRAAFATDGNYVQPWWEYLQSFSVHSSVYEYNG